MPDQGIASFSTFGDLLKYLRRRAQLTQRELAIAVGYTEGHVSRLEKNQRLPDLATVAALFIPALGLEEEPETSAQLLRLAASAHGGQRAAENLTISRVQEATEISESAESIPSNLPIQLSTFIGRQAEIAEIARLLSRPNSTRLVTLTGPGGIGKTRLALQTALELSHLYPDGIWFVDLSPLSTPELIAQTTASALNVTETGGQSVEENLIFYLRSKQAVMLVDNCEHLIDAAAQLAEKILRSCAAVQILATSREPLNIPGEANFHVPPLSLPKGTDSAIQTVVGHEAVQLFLERARSIQPSFGLTEANAPIITRICRQLDGMPLAIELAAARLAVLDVGQIAARLDDRFNLLTSGSRTALPRHQTLRAVIDWSYDLLSEQEKILLRRLSIFSGGWTLEAAEKVTADDMMERGREADPHTPQLRIAVAEILDLLSHLVSKSLIMVERQPGSELRYRMLETVRQYARKKLATSGEEEQVQKHHLEFFSSLAERAEPELRGHKQIEWLGRIDSDYDNLRAALRGSLEEKYAEAALRLVGALFPFWHIRGYASEGRRWLEAALAMADNIERLPRSSWQAKALFGHGVLAYLQGDDMAAHVSLEKSLTIYRELADRSAIGHVLHRLAAIPFWHGDYATARSLYEESLSSFQEARDAWGIGNSLYSLARLAQREGNFKVAYSFFEESAALLRQVGDKQSLTRPLEYLGWEVWFRGNLARARALLEESLSLYRALNTKSGLPHTLGWLSEMAVLRGDYVMAQSLEEEGLSIGRELGRKQDVAWSLGRLGEIYCRQGDFTQACVHYEESRRLFEEMNDPAGGTGWVLRLLGRVAYHQGDYGQAAALLNESLALHEQAYDEPLIFLTLLYLGDLARMQGDYDLAAMHYRRSLILHRKRDAKIEVADRLEGLAKVAGNQGQFKRAARLFGAAQTLRDQLETPQIPVEQADYDRNLAVVRTALGDEAFSLAWAEGQAMLAQGLDHVVEYALAPGESLE
jgi:predicted ATPase/DNA-binding XRE family transcriptional regulator